MPQFSQSSVAGQAIAVPKGDRWQVHYRLQELTIPSSCPPDGTLRVEVNTALALILVRSTVQQFTAPRRELVDWLDRCWHTEVICKQNH